MISDRVVASLVAYAVGRQGAEDVTGRLARHGLEHTLARPSGEWFDGALLQRVATALAAPDQTATELCREAGFAALRLEPMGALSKLADVLSEPHLGFRQLVTLLPVFVQGAEVSVERELPGEVDVAILLPPLAEPNALVAFGIGLFEALPTFWGQPGGQSHVTVGADPGGRLRVLFSVTWSPHAPDDASEADDQGGDAGAATAVRASLEGSWFHVDAGGRIVGVGGSLGAPLGLVGSAVGRRLVEIAAAWQQAPPKSSVP